MNDVLNFRNVESPRSQVGTDKDIITAVPESYQCTFPFGLLHSSGYKVAVESNGTVLFPGNPQTKPQGLPTGTELWFPDHLTLSPKETEPQPALVRLASEIKVVVRDEKDVERALSGDWPAVPVYLQPVSNDERATRLCVQAILQHPHLRLSMQVHKWIGMQ